MTRHLVLITNTFPFGRGEEFIEAEAPIVARHFDQVHVIATQVPDDATQTRVLPPNARPHSVRTPQQGLRGRLTFLAAGLPRALRHRTSRARSGEGSPHPSRVASALFFEARAQFISSRVLPIIDAIPLRAGDEVVVYSFWLHLTARVGELVVDSIRARQAGVRVRFVSRAHGYDLYHEASTLGFLPQRHALLSALDAVYPVSQAGADHLTAHYPEYAGKVRVQRLGSRDPDPLPLVSRDRLYITSCAFVVPIKRLDRFPPIMERLAERGVPVTWTHIGGGPGLAELQAQAAQVNTLAEVRFVGHLDHRQLFDHYARTPSTVFLSLSAREGLPVSMMEAISGAIPLVATRVGGVPEIVRAGVSGVLVPAEFTDDEVVDALLSVWRMGDEEYAALSASARRLWEQEFRASTTYERFASLLTS
ncbi:MAG TPA: glycosyltransferase [Arachnia sp.]|nr:glycosyltransferase [Arachnia sp.]